MALARCDHCRLPKSSPEPYTDKHIPVNCSDNGVRCCATYCLNLASIWLTAGEQKRYIAGERIFRYSSRSNPAQVA
jgi:hypothetical protein